MNEINAILQKLLSGNKKCHAYTDNHVDGHDDSYVSAMLRRWHNNLQLMCDYIGKTFFT